MIPYSKQRFIVDSKMFENFFGGKIEIQKDKKFLHHQMSIKKKTLACFLQKEKNIKQ
jgi:hypothetical protein